MISKVSIQVIIKVSLCICGMCFVHHHLFAQNLLPDGGFEQLTSSLCMDPDESFSRLEFWYPLDASPDLFVSNCTYSESDFIYWDESSTPYEGQNFAGIWSRWNSNSTYFSEGIATSFTAPLIAGETYQFEMKIKNRGGFQGLDASVSGCSLEPEKHIDLYLSNDSIRVDNNFSNGTASTTATLVATMASASITGGSNDDWSSVSTCFTARGGERFLALIMPLGTFGELPACAIMASSGVFRSFYYQIDAAEVTILPEVFTAQTVKCSDEKIDIDLPEYFDFDFTDSTVFIWEDGFVGEAREVTENRLFEIKAQLTCGDVLLELLIEGTNCSEAVYIPNAFSPNNDGINDELIIGFANQSLIEDYSLSIYDRWGGLVFNTRDPLNSWDGSFNGRNAASGNYVLELSYSVLNGNTFDTQRQLVFLSR